jgi:uncharacterized protein (TIGR02300 family)
MLGGEDDLPSIAVPAIAFRRKSPLTQAGGLSFLEECIMGRPEFGTKCTCTGCHQRFYDLNRTPVICPKCGAQQSPETPRGLQPSRNTFGGLKPRQQPAAVTIDDDFEPAGTSEVEGDVDVPEADDEGDDDIEIDPDLVKPAD